MDAENEANRAISGLTSRFQFEELWALSAISSAPVGGFRSAELVSGSGDSGQKGDQTAGPQSVHRAHAAIGTP